MKPSGTRYTSELALQPPAFTTRCIEAGYCPSSDAGRMGRGEKLPPQLGQRSAKTPEAHDRQNVHSKVQITASLDSGGKSVSQHSQLGFNLSIEFSELIHNAAIRSRPIYGTGIVRR